MCDSDCIGVMTQHTATWSQAADIKVLMFVGYVIHHKHYITDKLLISMQLPVLMS